MMWYVLNNFKDIITIIIVPLIFASDKRAMNFSVEKKNAKSCVQALSAISTHWHKISTLFISIL